MYDSKLNFFILLMLKGKVTEANELREKKKTEGTTSIAASVPQV